MFAAQSLWCVLVARFFSGIGAAGSITVVSIYNNEIAEPRLKSSLGIHSIIDPFQKYNAIMKIKLTTFTETKVSIRFYYYYSDPDKI